KAYGTTDPALTATATGFTAADALTMPLRGTRAAGGAVGSYVTTATATGVALSNYTVTYEAGSFTVTKAAATVTAGRGAKAYGTSDPTLSAPTQRGRKSAEAGRSALTTGGAVGEVVGGWEQGEAVERAAAT